MSSVNCSVLESVSVPVSVSVAVPAKMLVSAFNKELHYILKEVVCRVCKVVFSHLPSPSLRVIAHQHFIKSSRHYGQQILPVSTDKDPESISDSQ